MPKKIIQDIVKKRVVVNKRKPIKPLRPLKLPKIEEIQPLKEEAIEPLKTEIIEKNKIIKKKNWKSIFLRIFIALVVIGLFKMALTNLSSAKIELTPRQEFISVNLRLNAARGEDAKKLPFEIVQLDYESSQKVSPTGTKEGGVKSSGQIVIYNDNSYSQKLIQRTRFEEPNGKIYRIPTSVVVPAKGFIEVTVYADQVGGEYNIGLTDFSIPGFKGDLRYKTMYARSKTAIGGGAKGTVLIFSEEDINRARNELEEKIKNYLIESISKQKQENYLLYKEALIIKFSDSSDNPKAGDVGVESDFKEKGEALGFLIKKNNLSNVLADNYLKEENIDTFNLKELEFSLLSKNDENTEITFNLSGKAHFIWNIDESSLVASLMEKENKDYNSVFNAYPNIEKAKMLFSPSWWHSMPKRDSRVNIETIYKQNN